MIIAKVLHYMDTEKASSLNWKKMTGDFSDTAIDAYIDLQNNQADKLAVCDFILQALQTDVHKHINEAEITKKLKLIRRMLENGVYSPYREIERLTKENNVKDRQITELMAQLEVAKDAGDELKETDLITKIVEHSVKLGVEVAKNVELVLGRIYRGTTKFAEHFKWLEDYIANTSSAGDILKAIAELNETLKIAANKPTNQFTVYPQDGSTANLGCRMQSPQFQVIPSSTEQQPKLESNKKGI